MTDSRRGCLTLQTLILCILCLVCVVPTMAVTQSQIQKDIEENGWYVNESGVLTHLYREFTFCDDSIGGSYRLLNGSHIHYQKGRTIVFDKNGTLIADILDENTGQWFAPGRNDDATTLLAPKSIEVPSESYVFHEENETIVIARDIDKTMIVRAIIPPDTFPPQKSGGVEHKSPNDGHTWVAWREIPINTANPVIQLSAEFSVEKTPTPKEGSKYNQAFHIFSGINTEERILQPVLSWNWFYEDNTARPDQFKSYQQWSISSHICGNEGDIHSPSKIIASSTSVTGEIKFINNHWEIITAYGSQKSVLNDVTKTNHPNPPGTNPIVVFALERRPAVCYPGYCTSADNSNPSEPCRACGSNLDPFWKWTKDHWPGKVTFSDIHIEPANGVLADKARNVLAANDILDFKVTYEGPSLSNLYGCLGGANTFTVETPHKDDL